MFNKTVAEVERLYMAEAEKQVRAAQQNQLVDYKEYHRYMNENDQLYRHIQNITEENANLSSFWIIGCFVHPEYSGDVLCYRRRSHRRSYNSCIIRWWR